jgi:uroporphyrinogen decarboxylase
MTMNSMQRVLTSLSHKEPDRVPLFLLTSMQGAKELKMSLKDYYASAERLAEAQIKMKIKYRNDCYYSFFYAPVETEAFGADVIYKEDGPVNSGNPFIKTAHDIENLVIPEIEDAPSLKKVITATRLLKQEAGDQTPIIGVVMSPFSLPVMQMGFERYLDLIHEEPVLFNKLMQKNEAFCVKWANAQLEAGATAICYFDPVSSPTIIPPELYRKTGFVVAKNTISQIKGATATHLASGRCMDIADDLCQTGTYVVGTSVEEDLETLKSTFQNKLTILGNLNGIEMCRWTPEEAEIHVKTAIQKAGKGGGFILSDNHGELPYQVSEKTLMAISDAVQKWGNYPLKELNG